VRKTQEKQPWAKRLDGGCNECSVAERVAVRTAKHREPSCEWNKGGASNSLTKEGDLPLCRDFKKRRYL